MAKQKATKTMLITLASSNPNKERELQDLLKETGITIQSNPAMPHVDETGATFMGNARLKALACPPLASSNWILAEDSGLAVDALNGKMGLSPFPGVRSNRWYKEAIEAGLLTPLNQDEVTQDKTDAKGAYNDINQGLLQLMAGEVNRSAHYVCAMVLHPASANLTQGEQHRFEVEGTMTLRVGEAPHVPRGNDGFGYDPIMIPVENNPHQYTVAEMSLSDKNKISHRAKAFEAVLQFLQTQAF